MLLENLEVLLESYIILLERKYSVLANFSGQNTFSKIVALIEYEGRIRLEVDKGSLVSTRVFRGIKLITVS